MCGEGEDVEGKEGMWKEGAGRGRDRKVKRREKKNMIFLRDEEMRGKRRERRRSFIPPGINHRDEAEGKRFKRF